MTRCGIRWVLGRNLLSLWDFLESSPAASSSTTCAGPGPMGPSRCSSSRESSWSGWPRRSPPLASRYCRATASSPGTPRGSCRSPSHQISVFRKCRGLSLQGLSSRISWPMNSIGIPGAVRSRAVATRARLRAYHERASVGSARAAGGRAGVTGCGRQRRSAAARRIQSMMSRRASGWSSPHGTPTAARRRRDRSIRARRPRGGGGPVCAWRRRFRPDGQQGTREPQIPAEEDGQAQGADDHERPRESRHHDPRELSEDGPTGPRAPRSRSIVTPNRAASSGPPCSCPKCSSTGQRGRSIAVLAPGAPGPMGLDRRGCGAEL